MTESNRRDPQDLFDAARGCLRRERRRTVDEQEAFEAFERRLRELDVASSTVREGVSRVQLAGTAPTEGIRAVREAYEATVMSVPHYGEEYDEPFEQHLQGEFSPELAALLSRGTAFDSRVRQRVLAAAAHAQETRGRLLEALDIEQESFEASSAELLSVASELPEYRDVTFADRRYGTLDAYRTRLLTLEESCEAVVESRQEALLDQHRSLSIPVDGPDVPTYVYRDLEVTYPVVATAADVLDCTESLRGDVERALMGASA